MERGKWRVKKFEVEGSKWPGGGLRHVRGVIQFSIPKAKAKKALSVCIAKGNDHTCAPYAT